MNNWVMLNIGCLMCGAIASIGTQDIDGLFIALIATVLSGIFYALGHM